MIVERHCVCTKKVVAFILKKFVEIKCLPSTKFIVRMVDS